MQPTMSEDSGPFCRHWSDPADCDLCREEDARDAELLARWGISEDNPHAPSRVAVGRLQWRLAHDYGQAEIVVDGLWGPMSQRGLERAIADYGAGAGEILRALAADAIAAGAKLGPF
jgi:hypothetical protein